MPAVDVDPLDDSLERRLGVDQVAILVGELFESGFELLQFVERVEVDRADVVDLVAKLGDFRSTASRSKAASWELASRECVSCRLTLGSPAPAPLLPLLQINPVVILHPFAECLALVAEPRRGHFHLVLLRLQCAKLLPLRADSIGQVLPLASKLFIGRRLLGELPPRCCSLVNNSSASTCRPASIASSSSATCASRSASRCRVSANSSSRSC